MVIDVLKVFAPAAMGFFAGMILAPFLNHYLYKYKAWKRTSRSGDLNNSKESLSEAFRELHNNDAESSTPRIGGILIWGTTSIVILIFWFLPRILTEDIFQKLNFLSRSQTWLPLFTLIAGSLVGLADDLFQIYGKGKKSLDGLSLRKRIGLVVLIGAIASYWFYFKLGMSAINVPFFGPLELGLLFIPFFIIVMVSVFAGGVIDGIDGLSGGVITFIFLAYMGIAFIQNQLDIAAFSGLIAGSTLAFLWFNIPPARFYMGETGMLGLTVTLTVIAFLTDAVIALPVIAFPLYAASGSSLIQVVSKKYFGKKVFKVAPIHHHFQSIGWPSYKVTMRFWIISIIFAIIGMIFALL